MAKRYGEARRSSSLGREGGTFYAEDLVTAREERRLDATFPKIIRAEDQVWEDSPHGRIKHVAHPRLNPRVKDVEAYIQEIPPDGRTGKRRHMAEEFMFVLHGRGYSVHWDVDLDMGERYAWKVSSRPQRFDWEASDWVFVPVNTVHQYFNTDPDHPARVLIIKCKPLYNFANLNYQEFIEKAPKTARPGWEDFHAED